MNQKMLFAALAGCVALGACASGRTEQSQQSPAGTDFTRELARQYYGFSEQQRVEAWDYDSYGYFDAKGDRAVRGEAVAPETPGQRFSPRNRQIGQEVTEARARLVSALEGGATSRAPVPAARAQVRYDCWVEHTDDPTWAVQGPWLNQKLQECRSEFQAAMAEVDAAMRPTPVAAPAPVAPPPPLAAAPREQSFLVFFDFDQSRITPEGQAVLQRAVQNYRQGGAPRIIVTGHADRAGPNGYNMALSERRAVAVRQALAPQGVTPGQVVTEARGETQPLVPTSDGVPEAQNRRAEIIIQ